MMLRADITLRGAVIHERLVAELGFTGSYQRINVSQRSRSALADTEVEAARGGGTSPGERMCAGSMRM